MAAAAFLRDAETVQLRVRDAESAREFVLDVSHSLPVWRLECLDIALRLTVSFLRHCWTLICSSRKGSLPFPSCSVRTLKFYVHCANPNEVVLNATRL